MASETADTPAKPQGASARRRSRSAGGAGRDGAGEPGTKRGAAAKADGKGAAGAEPNAKRGADAKVAANGGDAHGAKRRADYDDGGATEVGERAAEVLEGGEDLGGLSAIDLIGAFRRAVVRPAVAREGARLTAEVTKVALGRSEVAPDRKDWRFKDPAWTENPVYRRVGQAYLASSQSLHRAVADADLDWRTAERARMAAEIVTSAAAPTNTLLGNPAALKRVFDTAGVSLVRGARNFIGDVRHNGGMPSQVDRRPFRVGENLAATPGAVVHRDEVCEVIQYTPSTPEVRTRPIMVIPPQIGRFYFMDLAPGRSFIEHAVSRGIQMFVVSWRNPTPAQRDWDLDTYVARLLEAVGVVTDITRSDDVGVLGLCAGGITTATLLSTMAQQGDERVQTASFGVTLLDFSVPAPIGMFLNPGLISRARKQSQNEGILSSQALGKVFAWLRPNDLVWNYWVNNYLLGNDPPKFDILAWNADGTNLPAALHKQFLAIFEDNLLVKPGGLTVLGKPVDLRKIDLETYVTGAITDHLTPWKGCYQTANLLCGDTTFVLSNAGHIASLVNPPGNPKAKMFIGPSPCPLDPDEWRAAAKEHQGTWWTHWADWQTTRAGEQKRAPQKLGSRRHKPLEPAPGLYVHG
jgi:polyhydroxyalkanoate synthase subunit PhaC